MRALWILLLLSLPGLAWAQTATPASRFAIDQAAPDVATANSYTYRLYADGAETGTPISFSCAGTSSPFVCTAAIPAFTPGSHSVQFTAANAAGESAKSAALSFTMVIIPSAPANPRIQ